MGGKKNRRRQQQEQEEQYPKKGKMLTEEQLMDKSHMVKTQYIPLLDTDSLYDPFTYDQFQEAALRQILLDLNHLLYVPFKTFWATMLYNPYLKHCLESCLRHLHRRWLNQPRYSKLEDVAFEDDEESLSRWQRIKDRDYYQLMEGLNKVVLMIYHRAVSFNHESKELSAIYKVPEEITKKYLLDFPKLIDLIDIYGTTNSDIVRYIVKNYLLTRPDFYQHVTQQVLPLVLRQMDALIRGMKVLTDRQEYGVTYSYKKLHGQEYSQGEEELRKKTRNLMQMMSFFNLLESLMDFFPQPFRDFCLFTIEIPFLVQNIFLELQAAYRVWNYQEQETTLLNLINLVLRKASNYFVNYFTQCNDVFVERKAKVSTFDAYVNSLNRVFRDFGRRNSIGKKGLNRNLIMYKIIAKDFDVLRMAQDIFEIEQMNDNENFNPEFLKEFIIALDTELKNDEYIHEDEPRQEEVEEETQAQMPQDEFQETPEENKKEKRQSKEETERQEEIAFEKLEMMESKRNRSEDYYSKLYANFNAKAFKGEYQDDYDDMVDFDKRPLFYDEGSDSESESDSEKERKMVSNKTNLTHVTELHSKHSHRPEKSMAVEQPKYTKMPPMKVKGQYEEKSKAGKTKYVSKREAEVEAEKQEEQRQHIQGEEIEGFSGDEGNRKKQEEEKRGGQGYKKSGKSRYRPKNNNHKPYDKSKNTNKNKEHQGQGGGKRVYQPKI